MSIPHFSAANTILDAQGQPCPAPLLMLKRALKSKAAMPILVKSSDPHSQQDISRYCQIQQLHCQMTKISETEFHYLIES